MILIDSILIAVGLVYFYIKNNSIVSIKKLTFKLDIAASARASLGVYNTKDDLDKLNSSINKCKKIFELK